MTLDLTALFFWLAFAASGSVTVAFGTHWAVEKWLSGKTEPSDLPFFASLGGVAATVALVLIRFMPG